VKTGTEPLYIVIAMASVPLSLTFGGQSRFGI
jgi:hypothetical protein